MIWTLSVEGDQAAPQNANLQTTNGFRQGAMSHFYDDHLRRLIVEYQTKISLHLSKDFEIFCEGEWEQSRQLTRIFDNDSNAAISQWLVGFGQTGLVGLVGHIGSVDHNGSDDWNGHVGQNDLNNHIGC